MTDLVDVVVAGVVQVVADAGDQENEHVQGVDPHHQLTGPDQRIHL